MQNSENIPSQKMTNKSLNKIPVEYFKWGSAPDHYKIDMPHRHEFAEFLFFNKGGGFHEIDFVSHNIESNSIHVIPASCVHFLKREAESDGFTISFDPNFLNENSIHRIINPVSQEAFILNLSEKQFAHLETIADVILKQIQSNKGYYKEKAFLIALDLLITTIANEVDSSRLSTSIVEDRIIQKFKVDVRSNVHLNSSVKFYADRLNISPKYLSNHLRTKTNKSAKQWIIEILLISVKKQLINGNLPIKQIAHNHNFNESSLSKLFKKHVAYTMTEYRSNKNVQF